MSLEMGMSMVKKIGFNNSVCKLWINNPWYQTKFWVFAKNLTISTQ
jgi:hypothetical protein